MPTLYDMILRHALYFEGARRGAAKDFGKIVRGLDAEIMRVFQRTTVDNMGNMTRAEFNKFVADLRRSMNRVFTDETKRLNTVSRRLADIENTIYQRMFRLNTGKRIARLTRAELWSGIRNKQIANNK